MEYVKFNNKNADESSIDLTGVNDNRVNSDKEKILPKDAPEKRKFPVLIVTIVISVLVIVIGVSIVFIHLKSSNSSDQQQNFAPFQFYIFGGYSEDGQFHPFASHFNSSTNEWEKINGAPREASSHYLCGAVARDKIYLFGGFHWFKPAVVNTTIVYDSSLNDFTFLQPMPEPRLSCAAAVLNGYVYVAGGSNGSYVSRMSSVIRFNIKTNQWSSVSSMNTSRRQFSLVELGSRLYAIGDGKTTEVYDPKTDRWSFVKSNGSERTRYDPGVAVHNGKIYVIEHRGEEGFFEVFSPETNQWRNLTAPPESYSFETLLSVNGKLWAFAQSNRINHDWKASKAVFAYDLSTKKWNQQLDMDVGRWSHAAFVIHH